MCKLQPNILQVEEYEKLKEAMVALHEKSKPKMLDKLMSSILTEKPTFYLNELMTLATKIGVITLYVIYLFKLRPVLAVRIDLETERLGKITDDLLSHFHNHDPSHIQRKQPR